ncbi:heavy-metal-associated domain-containing protein [Flavobacterium sp.]|uniref:heavy-metal-associated domain-containing protein n=1 Tax=Flavobacterium sp. TaxID=239 RepID=UPI003529A793
MKIIKGIGLVVLASMFFVACKEEAAKTEEITVKKEKVIADNAKMEEASFTIDGMTCAMGCAKAIEGELSALEGVQEAKVDFDTKEATVSFDANVQDLASLTKTIEATAGGDSYKVTASKVVIN